MITELSAIVILLSCTIGFLAYQNWHLRKTASISPPTSKPKSQAAFLYPFTYNIDGDAFSFQGALPPTFQRLAAPFRLQHLLEITEPAYAGRLREALSQTRSLDQPLTLELRIQDERGDFHPHQMVIYSSHRSENPGAQVCGVLAPIHDSASNASFQEPHQHFQKLIEHIPHIAVQGYDQDLRVFFWNQSSETLYGYTSEEAIGKRLDELILDRDTVQLLKDDFNHIQPQQSLPTRELALRRKDGRTVYVLGFQFLFHHGQSNSKIYCFDIDVTDAHHNREQLQYRDDLFRRAIEVANLVPYYLNYKTNQYEFMGDGIEKITGYSPEEFTTEIRDQNELQVIPLGHLSQYSLEEAIENARQSPGVSWLADICLRHRNGEVRWVTNAAVQVHDSSGELTGSLGIIQDITDRKRMESDLLHVQKFESIAHLAGGLAHNVNNLLTGIMGNIELAERKCNESVKHNLEEAKNAANRAAALVLKMQNFSRKIELNPISTDLNGLTQEALRLTKELLDPRIQINTELHSESLPVYADETLINAVIINLILNAQDAIVPKIASGTEEESSPYQIDIRTSAESIDQQQCAHSPQARPGFYAVLRVTDNGIGIDEQLKEYIFEPFFTTKNTIGNGLGLASSYGVMQAHHGWIQFSSRYGEQTQFAIFLPQETTPST